eukprot:snap_masked-scaffold_58-processed-gene-0.53-mRNA-1 protein AED:1.00 eAED:1.00 QI:0/0/0/0/1/1/2/0/65
MLTMQFSGDIVLILNHCNVPNGVHIYRSVKIAKMYANDIVICEDKKVFKVVAEFVVSVSIPSEAL